MLCIAHRLHTIAYYDLIAVMDKGAVVEYGAPLDLIDNANSLFRGMCESTGDFDGIYKIAKAAV